MTDPDPALHDQGPGPTDLSERLGELFVLAAALRFKLAALEGQGDGHSGPDVPASDEVAARAAALHRLATLLVVLSEDGPRQGLVDARTCVDGMVGLTDGLRDAAELAAEARLFELRDTLAAQAEALSTLDRDWRETRGGGSR